MRYSKTNLNKLTEDPSLNGRLKEKFTDATIFMNNVFFSIRKMDNNHPFLVKTDIREKKLSKKYMNELEGIKEIEKKL